jgi:pilus assembly protein Flp/PilA
MQKIRNFVKNSKGATAIEYGLIAALIAVVLVVSLQGVGDALSGAFQKINTEVTSATSGG